MSLENHEAVNKKQGIVLVGQLKRFYQAYDVNNLDGLSDIYTQDVEFVDPIERIQGIFALKNYLSRQGQQLNYARFEYRNELIGENQAYIRWDMVFSHPKLAGGKELVLPGMSEVHFTNRIYFQQDSYDLGAMLYEHVPFLGMVVRTLKKRLSHA